MKQYKLKDHVTDEMLVAVGFKITDNSYGQVGFESNFESIRKVDEDYDLVIQDRTKKNMEILAYKVTSAWYEDPYDNKLDVEDYIQDLIELGYVEEMK